MKGAHRSLAGRPARGALLVELADEAQHALKAGRNGLQGGGRDAGHHTSGALRGRGGWFGWRWGVVPHRLRPWLGRRSGLARQAIVQRRLDEGKRRCRGRGRSVFELQSGLSGTRRVSKSEGAERP